MANESILVAFERMWQHVVAKVGTKDEAISNLSNSKQDKITGGDITVGSDGSVSLNSGVVGTTELADGAVNRAKLAQNALYSPVTSKTGTYNIVADDLGRTIVGNSSNAVTIVLTDTVATAFPVGAEIAVLRTGTGDVDVKFSGTGYAIGNSEHGIMRTADATVDTIVRIPECYGMIALKKIFNDTWVITGNVEVV